jgi:hypothetical protein
MKATMASMTNCALCGYPTRGDFYVLVPGFPDQVMHTISCGPVLNGDQPVPPTLSRRADGSIEVISS